jgi:hypothetical protein
MWSIAILYQHWSCSLLKAVEGVALDLPFSSKREPNMRILNHDSVLTATWLLVVSACGGPSIDPFKAGSGSAAFTPSAGTDNSGATGAVPNAGGSSDTGAVGESPSGASAIGGSGSNSAGRDGNAGGGMAPSDAGGAGGPANSAGMGGSGAVVDPDSACFGNTVVPEPLLADCEGDMKGWFGYVGSDSAPVYPAHPGAQNSATAADFQGGHATSSGMGIGLSCDDVSGYRGVSFWAKGRGGEKLRFLVAIPATDTKPGRGDCDPEQVKCNDHPGKALVLKAEWTRYAVLWDELEQYGWGEPAKFSGIANSLLWINDGTVDSFDFAIDQVELLETTP